MSDTETDLDVQRATEVGEVSYEQNRAFYSQVLNSHRARSDCGQSSAKCKEPQNQMNEDLGNR